jgi:hypothetical protein
MQINNYFTEELESDAGLFSPAELHLNKLNLMVNDIEVV